MLCVVVNLLVVSTEIKLWRNTSLCWKIMARSESVLDVVVCYYYWQLNRAKYLALQLKTLFRECLLVTIPLIVQLDHSNFLFLIFLTVLKILKIRWTFFFQYFSTFDKLSLDAYVQMLLENGMCLHLKVKKNNLLSFLSSQKMFLYSIPRWWKFSEKIEYFLQCD